MPTIAMMDVLMKMLSRVTERNLAVASDRLVGR